MAESWSAQDYRAGREGWTHYTPVDPVSYGRGQAERQGSLFPDFGGSGGGGGSGYLAILVILLAPILLIIGLFILVPLYPVAGGIAAVAGYLLETFIFNDPTTTGMVNDSSTLLFSFIVFMLALKLERRAEEFARYRQIRHWTRVVGLAFGINEAMLPLLALFLAGREAAYGWGLTGGFALVPLLRFIALMVVLHVGFRWLQTGRAIMPLKQRFGFAEPY